MWCTKQYYDPKYVACLNSHTVGLGQATQGSVFGQEAILQINHSLPDLLVFGQHVVVVNHHPKILLQGEGAGELEHPAVATDQQRCEFTLRAVLCLLGMQLPLLV